MELSLCCFLRADQLGLISWLMQACSYSMDGGLTPSKGWGWAVAKSPSQKQTVYKEVLKRGWDREPLCLRQQVFRPKPVSYISVRMLKRAEFITFKGFLLICLWQGGALLHFLFNKFAPLLITCIFWAGLTDRQWTLHRTCLESFRAAVHVWVLKVFC